MTYNTAELEELVAPEKLFNVLRDLRRKKSVVRFYIRPRTTIIVWAKGVEIEFMFAAECEHKINPMKKRKEKTQ